MNGDASSISLLRADEPIDGAVRVCTLTCEEQVRVWAYEQLSIFTVRLSMSSIFMKCVPRFHHAKQECAMLSHLTSCQHSRVSNYTRQSINEKVLGRSPPI